ncbi:hypothetical protein ACN9MF_04170 [Methylobacterium fujisawaense]|uniref:hypothetical protein n=1 Tax=Methylobacterium fujisawaense TaxID=107400 RepID=UPI003CFBA6DE
MRTGLSATTSTIAGVAAQIPSLNTLLAAFLGFEAAGALIADFVRIGRKAEKAGVGAGFFQRATLDAEKFGLTVEQVTAAFTIAG